MEYVIRRGGLSDAVAAAELWLKARRAAIDVIPAPVHSDDEVCEWFSRYVVRRCEFWIAQRAVERRNEERAPDIQYAWRRR
jgi:hypothetical protein